MGGQVLSWLGQFAQNFSPFGITDVIDIAVVAIGLYLLLRLVQGTRAVQLIKGFVAVLAILIVTEQAHLKASNWILSVILSNWVIALIVLFQPELRMMVEQIGRGRFLRDAFRPKDTTDHVPMVNEIVRAARRLSERKVGALIAIEREVGLKDIVSTGRSITGAVSGELLETIFHPGTPMHDGGVVVQSQQVAAAMCLFPLSDGEQPRSLGTRHRAAIGLSEVSDAVIVVVSEETGGISLALEGYLTRNLSPEALKEHLLGLLRPEGDDSASSPWFWRREPGKRRSGTHPRTPAGEGRK